MLANPRRILLVWLVGATSLSPGIAAAVEADVPVIGGGQDSERVDTDSEFTSLGEVVAEIGVTRAEGSGVGAGGSWVFPVNVTVYGKPYVVADGGPEAWDEYCFKVAYSLSPIVEVDDLQTAANGLFELTQDREYYEPAMTQYRDLKSAYDAAVEAWAAVRDENGLREESGLEPLPYPNVPAEPEQPTFPLPVCEGSPAEVPDFRPAFDAAAELIERVDEPSLHIAPGWGVTGIEAYLETGREMAFVEAERDEPQLGWDLSDDPLNPTPIAGTVSFAGTGSYSVDWGDGTVTGPHVSGGVPYGFVPDPADPSDDLLAPVTHTYADKGNVVITVTDTWEVALTVTFLGERYTFVHSETLAPWPAMPFEVREVRSVRER